MQFFHCENIFNWEIVDLQIWMSNKFGQNYTALVR